MKKYRSNFKGYLKDLAAKNPSPGGGSAAALMCCVGISLLQMAMRYSALQEPSVDTYVARLETIKSKVFPVIDDDARLFGAVMANQGKKRSLYLAKCDAMLGMFGQSCVDVLIISKTIESRIKKSIMSDFHSGRQCVVMALNNCVHNLEANELMFGVPSKHTPVLKKFCKTK